MSWVISTPENLRLENFKEFKAFSRKQSDCSIKILHIVRKREFVVEEFNIFYKQNGIHE